MYDFQNLIKHTHAYYYASRMFRGTAQQKSYMNSIFEIKQNADITIKIMSPPCGKN